MQFEISGSLAGLVACVVASALFACGPAPCKPTGYNTVTGSATVVSSGEKCVADVRGRINDAGGETHVSVSCAEASVPDPLDKPKYQVQLKLDDPRVLDGSSQATAQYQSGSGGVSASAPVNATVANVDAIGSKAPLPAAATDDFVRTVRVRVMDAGVVDLTVEITIRASDLRTSHEDCPFH